MNPRQLAIWSAPGESPRSGVVVDPGKKGSRSVLVQWDDGERASVRKRDPDTVFVPEGSILAKWALNLGELEDLLRVDPAGAFRSYLQEQSESVTQGQLVKAIGGLGFPPETARAAWERARPILRSDSHIATRGVRYRWSDEPIDPFAALRNLAPEAALERLLKGNLKAPQKEALAEAIRAGFR
jgi:hypothetical protein